MSTAHTYFTATFLDQNGKKVSRDFFGMSEKSIGQQILQGRGTIISIRPGRTTWMNREYYSTAFKINFLDALIRRTKSMSPSQALDAVIQNEKSRAKRREMEVALQTLNNGRDFSDAVEKLGFLSPPLIAILRSGERSGMRNALETAKKYLSDRKVVMRQFGMAVFWISMEFLSAVTIPFDIQFGALPWIESHANGSTNPADIAAFKSDMHLAYLLNGIFMWFTVLLIISVIVLYLVYQQNDSVRRKVGEWLIKMPILNRFVVDSAIADSFLIASNMLQSHVPFFEVVGTLRDVGVRGVVHNYWNDVADHLERCGDPSEALVTCGVLHKDEIQLLENQSGSIQLAEAMASIAEDRAHSASHGRVLAVWSGAVVMIAYSAVSLGIAAWIYMIYSNSMDLGLKDMTGMSF